jgi:hypothetical protein
MICNMLGCDTEAYANVMFYHFEEGSSKPYCQQIMRVYLGHFEPKRAGYYENYNPAVTKPIVSVRLPILE